jgi:predicted HTH domain antitoxin
MHTLTIDLPETLLLASGQSREEFLREARFLLALKLFELGRLSSGKAAELSVMSRAEFLFAASRAGVPVASIDETEAAEEFRDL